MSEFSETCPAGIYVQGNALLPGHLPPQIEGGAKGPTCNAVTSSITFPDLTTEKVVRSTAEMTCDAFNLTVEVPSPEIAPT